LERARKGSRALSARVDSMTRMECLEEDKRVSGEAQEAGETGGSSKCGLWCGVGVKATVSFGLAKGAGGPIR
jgi:hypothetical protein